MATVIAAIAMLNVCALAGVLLFVRYSAVLVDEDGRPLLPGHWQEHVVPVGETPRPSSPLDL